MQTQNIYTNARYWRKPEIAEFLNKLAAVMFAATEGPAMCFRQDHTAHRRSRCKETGSI